MEAKEEAQETPSVERAEEAILERCCRWMVIKKAHIPPKDHPWRKYPIVNRYRHKEIRESLLTET